MIRPAQLWTTDEVAAYFGTTPEYFRKTWPRLVKTGFPRPMPWPKRPRRWVPDMVRDWAAGRTVTLAGEGGIDPAALSTRLANLKQRRQRGSQAKE